MVVVIVLLLAAVGGVFVAVAVRVRHLRQLAGAVDADRIPPPAARPELFRVKARHEDTALEFRGSRIPVGSCPHLAIADLVVTDRDLILQRESAVLMNVPLERVLEPSLITRFGEVNASDVGGILQVDWQRGGLRITSVFAIDGTVQDAERMRKEIHLRAGRTRFPLPVVPS